MDTEKQILVYALSNDYARAIKLIKSLGNASKRELMHACEQIALYVEENYETERPERDD